MDTNDLKFPLIDLMWQLCKTGGFLVSMIGLIKEVQSHHRNQHFPPTERRAATDLNIGWILEMLFNKLNYGIGESDEDWTTEIRV